LGGKFIFVFLAVINASVKDWVSWLYQHATTCTEINGGSKRVEYPYKYESDLKIFKIRTKFAS
jgi:hypothetical protein